jgi:hypothetical protein
MRGERPLDRGQLGAAGLGSHRRYDRHFVEHYRGVFHEYAVRQIEVRLERNDFRAAPPQGVTVSGMLRAGEIEFDLSRRDVRSLTVL